jgi:baculoviral IAP repeat-containing protein 2/3
VALSLEEEVRRLKEARLCKICMDEEVGVVFLPCGHLVTCVNCAPSLHDCPVCRQLIKATVRTFLS